LIIDFQTLYILIMVKEGGTRVPSIETGHFQDQVVFLFRTR